MKQAGSIRKVRFNEYDLMGEVSPFAYQVGQNIKLGNLACEISEFLYYPELAMLRINVKHGDTVFTWIDRVNSQNLKLEYDTKFIIENPKSGSD
jgi:hypothetical protein